MKALVCEMCNSNDIIKQDGVYVCQACGTKYSVEEAKKMMFEGSVDVSGSTVKIDNSDLLENYYNMAESAYLSSNQKEAENYCNKILEIEPENYKAWLLKGKAAGWQSTLGTIRIEESDNCFAKAIDNAPSEDVERIKEEAEKEIEALSRALIKLCCDNYIKQQSSVAASSIINNLPLVQRYGVIFLAKYGAKADALRKEIVSTIHRAVKTAFDNSCTEFTNINHPSEYDLKKYVERGDTAISIFDCVLSFCDFNEITVDIYSYMIWINSNLIGAYSESYTSDFGYIKDVSLDEKSKQIRIDRIMEWHQKIKEIDPSYVIPERPETKDQNGACYVATAVYGSYDCPEVWTLRRYRDYHLAETWYGRAFVHTYYMVSPWVVKHFGNVSWFKRVCRIKLDKMVRTLQIKGYESSPYQDRDW